MNYDVRFCLRCGEEIEFAEGEPVNIWEVIKNRKGEVIGYICDDCGRTK